VDEEEVNVGEAKLGQALSECGHHILSLVTSVPQLKIISILFLKPWRSLQIAFDRSH
jgi:hypothetical protein